MTDYTDSWTFPPEKDGWFRAHNAIRQDMKDINRMLSAFISQLQTGKPLSPDQVQAAKGFWKVFYNFLHHHHDNEEKYAMPLLAKRAQIPSRIADDHVFLMDCLDKASELLNAALDSPETGAASKALIEVQAKFEKLGADMLEHFDEEEKNLMPMMRKHVSQKEYVKHVVTPIVRSMGPMDNGNFFDNFSGPDDVKDFAKQEGIPFFIMWLLNWHVKKYLRNIKEPFEKAVKEAQTAAVSVPASAA